MDLREIVPSDDMITLEDKGRKIYRDNEHYRRLANFMEHPEFREFYDNYMKDWESVKTIMLFMKTYEVIEKYSATELTPYQKLSVIKDMIENSNIRQKVCEKFVEWSGDKNNKMKLILGEEKDVK